MRAVRNSSPSRRLRALVLAALGLLLVLFLSASGIAQVYTDWLWFSQLGFSSIWTTVVGTQIVLVVMFTTLFFLILWGNLTLADRLAPTVRPASPEEDLIERYHQMVGPYAGRIRVGISALFALVAGINTSQEWRTWLLFRNGGEFGWDDPLFGRDAGYYVFELPFWTFLIDWFFNTLVFALLVSLIAHYLNGGIRAAGGPSDRVTASVKVHLSGLLAVLAVLRAFAYWHDRYELVTSTRGVVDGALATDVDVQLPALNLLTLISVFGAVLFLVNIRRRGWGLPLVAVGLWAVTHIAVGGIYPALYQRLRVVPEQSSREAEYITDNIAATRFAYGLDTDNLTQVDYAYTDQLTVEDVEASAGILEDVAILDPELATEPFTRNQAVRQSYEFADRLDVDRYEVDGDIEPVVLSVRGLNLGGVSQGWETQHLAFTHGYAAVVALSDRVAGGGNPDYAVSGVGPGLEIVEGFNATLDQPHVYFSENFGGYAIVGATRDEVDYPADVEAPFRYDGEGGVGIGSLVRRLAFSLRFQQLDPLISNFITDESRVIYNRDVEGRVRQLAPFLQFDSDPYPVLVDGRISWVIDGYTTTSRFPYAQGARGRSLGGTDLAGGYNYVRNSVKAVVDGYDGDVSMYVVDPDDPLINAWSDAFPDLFTPISEVPADLEAHFKYPVDIFKVQTEMYSTYQVSEPRQFLQGDLAWSVATQPATDASRDSGAAATTNANNPMVPQYRVTQLPGETESEFVVQRAFVPASSGDTGTERPELTGVLVARSDPGRYGELVLYRLPSSEVPAPDLVSAEIQKEDSVARDVTLLGQQGSIVQFGEMQMVLMANTVVYARPLYIKADDSTGVPQLNRVIAVNGDRIAQASTLEEAVLGVTVGAPPPPTPDTDVGGSDESDAGSLPPIGGLDDLSVVDLLARADELLARADTAEQNGNPEDAADLRREARQVLDRLAEVLGVEPSRTEDSGEA